MWSVFFVFLSYLDRNFVKGDFLSRALDAEKESKEMFSMLNDTFCAKMSTVRENFLYQVSDGAEAVRSVVSPAGKLVSCSVSVNQLQVKSFMHECRLGLKEQRAGRQLETRFTHMDEAKLICREFKERSGRSGRVKGDESQDKVLHRSKRGFTYPGTLWCGAGNMADGYDQLGEFAETDSCCRVHDHCPHVIHAFSSKYGHTNFKWHSICHCDCDNTLKDCLRKVNDTSSRVVGQAFFNVIGVPCFEFAYEEQCAERHWYGMCKRYEKFPIAVLKEAIPYDFGGIDVIDVLTVDPPKREESKKSEEEEKPEGTTQSTMSGPEEASLRNVVTAAEDFIKVLATVSTSQSSTTDSDKGDTQSAEKKKTKNTGKKKKKKTTKKQRGKGKGRKSKQKAEANVKIEDGAAAPTSGGKAEEVAALSNFISESHKHDQLSRNTNRIGDSENELAGKKEPFNEVMKDEPVMNKETIFMTTIQEKPAESDTKALTESTEESPLSTAASTTVNSHEAKTRRFGKGKRKKSKKMPHPFSEELVMNTTDNLRAISVATFIAITPTAQPKQQSFESNSEKRPVISTARTLTVTPKVKRNRSKERKDREERKKRKKVSSASPSMVIANEKSSEDNVKVIPLTGAPTVPMVSPTERQVPHTLNVYERETSVRVSNSYFTVLKRKKSIDRGLRNRRRKTTLDNFHNSFENVLPVLSTPETSGALNSPAATAAISRLTEETGLNNDWSLFTTVTASPSVFTKRHRKTIRPQQKPRKKVMAAALSNGVTVPKQTPLTFTTTPSNVATTEEFSLRRSEKPNVTTSVAPAMSPLQLSIERAKAQFSWKRTRKMASSLRHQ